MSSSDEGLSGFGVVRPPGLRPAANNTVVANIAGDGNYPRNTPIEEVLAAIGGLQYQGTWNAATNTPTITSGVGTNGQFYIVSVAGSTTIDGISQWSVGDWIIYTSDTDIWQKVEGGLTNAEINAALGHDLTLGGDLTTTGAFSTAGSFGVTLTSTGATNVTLPTSGTLATVAATLQVANNLSDLNNAATARTNLGLGTAATQSTGTFLQVANNLSDLASASTARTNLGLGTAAVLNVGTGANNIVQLTAGGILPAVDGSQLTNLPAAGGTLLAANNLSDVANAATSRTNLGLGTAATQATSAFLQPANNLSDVSTVATARTNLGLGTAATQADTFFLQVANNLSDLNNAATARTNLGLGTAATQATSAFLQPGNNLSDVSNASTARTNLGLGAAATQALSAFLQPTNNLSDVSSAATSRVNLNINKYTSRGDANYTIQTTDVVVALTATLTTTRTWTLPAASGVNAGQGITIIDLASGVSSTNFITIARAGADTVNGTTSVNFTVPYGAVTLISDGTSAWEATKIGLEQGGTGATTASAARTNLGLGTAATQNTSAFLQPANNLSDVSAAATARTNLGLGTAATQATSAFLQPANNLSDVSNASTARTNLGLGTAATQATSAFLQPANNLSDVSNASTSRTNLGLGTIATQANTAVNIDGGAIDGTTIGATTPSTGVFTAISTQADQSLTALTLGRYSSGFAAAIVDTTASTVVTSMRTSGVATLDMWTTFLASNLPLMVNNSSAPTSPLHVTGPIALPFTTVTTDTTLTSAHSTVISNRAATNTLTLPAAADCVGRIYNIQTIQAQAVVSASSNVVPKTGAAASTSILPATDGAWCTLQSDGTNWRIIRSGT